MKDYRQERFDVGDYKSREECILAKCRRAAELRGEGYKVVSCILKNQERGYSGLGTTNDTSVRDVFIITIYSSNPLLK